MPFCEEMARLKQDEVLIEHQPDADAGDQGQQEFRLLVHAKSIFRSQGII